MEKLCTENLEKGMIYMKILKKGEASREKGGGGNEIHAPCACDPNQVISYNLFNNFNKS
jgi:hypothetical protein